MRAVEWDYRIGTHEGFLSNKSTFLPFSNRVCAALRPASPPPTIMVRCVVMAVCMERVLKSIMDLMVGILEYRFGRQRDFSPTPHVCGIDGKRPGSGPH